MSFAPIFDGQYRARPQVSLRGASKQEEREKLLQRARKEREERELTRRKQQATLTIQAFYRGYLHRQKLYGELRAEFDVRCTSCDTPEAVLGVTRLLVMFYQHRKDSERLLKLCQKWLQFRQALSSSLAVALSPLRRMLALCCSSLHHCGPSQPLALPLRMIEVFLTPDSYPGDQRGKAMISLCSFVVRNGYFSNLKALLEQRVPPPEGLDHTPSPLGKSLLDYLTRPLLSGREDKMVYTSFASELFTAPLTAHVCHLVLPRLVTFDLSLERLLVSLLEEVSLRGVVSSSRGVASPPVLLYAILQLVHPRIKVLNQELLAHYLRLLALLLKHSTRDHVTSHDPTVDEDYDDDDVMEVEEGSLDPLGSHDELLQCCVATITGGELAQRLKLEKELAVGVLTALASLCYQLIVVKGSASAVTKTKLFQQLALNWDLYAPLWTTVSQLTVPRSFGEPVACLQQLGKGLALPPKDGVALVERLSAFCVLFSLYLSTLHDAEFYREIQGSRMPFSTGSLREMVPQLRDVFISLHLEKHLPHAMLQRKTTPTAAASPSPFSSSAEVLHWNCLKMCVHGLLCALYERHCRRPFCPNGHWEVLTLQKIPAELFLESEDEDSTVLSVGASVLKQAELLKIAPFVFPFLERVKFFTSLVVHDHSSSQGRQQDFLMGPSLHVKARRDHLYEDAFTELAHGADLRQKLRVNFVNVQGLDEAGIDGGGVFREFLTEVLKTGFDPNRGYFTTNPNAQLYPNPQAYLLSEDCEIHYRFLGSMLGKALYEGLLVELPFASFFLCKLSDRGRGSVAAHHLASLDPELYRHLLSLKHYEGDIEELSLTFTIVSNDFGQSKVVELKPGGSDIAVTKANCIEYIHLVAHYMLNVKLHRQFQAFRQGLSTVIPLHWLRLFNQDELQTLVSGAEVPISVEDLRKNSTYSGDYSDEHATVQMFWQVVSGFSEMEKKQLLKFVTSCSRPPLLGFKQLHPPFRIIPGLGDDRLPSASTCMNVLKLPKFSDRTVMKEKLLYALHSGTGFELS